MRMSSALAVRQLSATRWEGVAQPGPGMRVAVKLMIVGGSGAGGSVVVGGGGAVVGGVVGRGGVPVSGTNPGSLVVPMSADGPVVVVVEDGIGDGSDDAPCGGRLDVEVDDEADGRSVVEPELPSVVDVVVPSVATSSGSAPSSASRRRTATTTSTRTPAATATAAGPRAEPAPVGSGGGGAGAIGAPGSEPGRPARPVGREPPTAAGGSPTGTPARARPRRMAASTSGATTRRGTAAKRASGESRPSWRWAQVSQPPAWALMTRTASGPKASIPAAATAPARSGHAGRPARHSTQARTASPSRARSRNRTWWALLAVTPSSSAISPGDSPWRRCRSSTLASRGPRAAAAAHTSSASSARAAASPASSPWSVRRSTISVVSSSPMGTDRRSRSRRLSARLRPMRSTQPPNDSACSSPSSPVQAARKASWATSAATSRSRTMR